LQNKKSSLKSCNAGADAIRAHAGADLQSVLTLARIPSLKQHKENHVANNVVR